MNYDQPQSVYKIGHWGAISKLDLNKNKTAEDIRGAEWQKTKAFHQNKFLT